MFFHLIPKRKKKKIKKLSPMKYSHHSTQAGKKKKITRNFFFSLGNIVKVCLPLRKKVPHKKKKIHPVPYFSHFFLSIPHRKKKIPYEKILISLCVKPSE